MRSTDLRGRNCGSWRSCLTLSAIALNLACGGDMVLQRNFRAPSAEESVPRAVVAEIEFWVVEASYEPEGVELQLLVTNRSNATATMGRAGILYGYGSLEYPLDRVQPDLNGELPTPVPETQAIAAGEAVELTLRFFLSRPQIDQGALWLRDLHLDQEPLAPVRLELPPRPQRGRG